jgi:hypothetical protein
MSLHHDRTVHGSRPNCGDGKRIGFVVRYITPAARSRDFPVVRARGCAACPQLELAGRPPEQLLHRAGARRPIANFEAFVTTDACADDTANRAWAARGGDGRIDISVNIETSSGVTR